MGHLINTTDDKMKESKNIFHEGMGSEVNGSISLSIFSKPSTIRRPKTAVFDKFNRYIG